MELSKLYGGFLLELLLPVLEEPNVVVLILDADLESRVIKCD